MAHIFCDLVYKHNRGLITLEQFIQAMASGLSSAGSELKYDQSKYGYKVKRQDFGPLWPLWQPLDECERIVDQTILQVDDFVQLFYNMLWPIIKITGYSTENLEILLPTMIAIIRRITNEDFLRVNCNNPTPYYCGRALIIIPGPRLLLFDTVPPDEMNPVTIERYTGIPDSYYANNAPLNCASSKRLQKEMQAILGLPYVMGLSHQAGQAGPGHVVLDIDTKCGCKVRLTIDDCNAYPHKGPEYLYINDIPYTPLYGKEWYPSMKLTDFIDAAHAASQCKHFSIV